MLSLKRTTLTLTHSCLKIFLTRVVWIFNIFESILNFEISNQFTSYLKRSCGFGVVQHIPFKCFLKIAFVREISPQLPDGFGRYRHEWVGIWVIFERYSVRQCYTYFTKYCLVIKTFLSVSDKVYCPEFCASLDNIDWISSPWSRAAVAFLPFVDFIREWNYHHLIAGLPDL